MTPHINKFASSMLFSNGKGKTSALYSSGLKNKEMGDFGGPLLNL